MTMRFRCCLSHSEPQLRVCAQVALHLFKSETFEEDGTFAQKNGMLVPQGRDGDSCCGEQCY